MNEKTDIDGMPIEETKPRKSKRPVDAEVKVIIQITRLLNGLEEAARKRILDWLASRFKEEKS